MLSAVNAALGVLQRIRAAITVSKRNAVDVAGKRFEAFFIRMRLAGKRQRHHGAAVKGIFEADDRRPLSVGARDFYRILYRFRTAVHEKSLLGKISRR